MLLMKKTLCLAIMAVSSLIGTASATPETEVVSCDNYINNRYPLVLDYYRTRFQLEFCFRDGKQHAGITNCQSTDFRKLDFHFNASLAAINLAKAACKRIGITYSISSCRSFIHNAYMLERFICVFGISPEPLRLGEFLTNYWNAKSIIIYFE